MQQGGGGSQYGAPPPEMPPFGISTSSDQPEAASPISSRPPPNFDELGPANMPGPPFPDDDSLAAAAVVDDTDRGGVPGNRWPRQETLALLKIRSEMDSVFRDATLKGPLWEEVSRKLAEMGYIRSAKKCKEKFENVHKYYKRTKEGRAGRQDGKSYRFFSQLEALHSSGGAASTAANPNPSPPPTIGVLPGLSGTSTRIHTTPISASPITTAAPASGIAGISLSSNTSSDDSDDEDTEEMVTGEGRKRKHPNVGQGDSSGGSSSTSRKMMAFFEGLMQQVMERQEAMQHKFLETIEKREQDRMIREEAWKRQEMARLNREHELMAQERAMAASRDAAVISFLQKITGQTISIPTPTTTTTIPAASAPIATPVSVSVSTPTPQPTTKPAQPPPAQNSMEIVRHQVSVSSELGIVPVQQESHEAVAAAAASSSRWPKAEVHALIMLRSGLESRYQEAGPKGPLWEEISSEMMKLGFNRSSKRCKEKWENINKYFKKVKESNKKRPEDAKTCPYFHQLDALYRKKLAAVGGGGGGGSSSIVSGPALQTETTGSNPVRQDTAMQPCSQQVPPAMVVPETEGKSEGGSPIVTQIPTSNGGASSVFFEEASSGSVMKKPEDIMKELMEQQQQHHHPVVAMEDFDKLEEHESDNMDEDEENDEDEDDGKMQYEIQFQRPNIGNGASGGAASSGNTTSSPTTATATTAGSYMAMVQ